MNIKSFLIAAASTAGILTLALPASAVIYDWQFTNENGNFGDPDDVVAGFVEFNDADVTPGATNVQATNLQITSVTNLPNGSDPFFGDGGIELNQNLVSPDQLPSENRFDFEESEIVDFNFSIFKEDSTIDENNFNELEGFFYGTNFSNLNNYSSNGGRFGTTTRLRDTDGSTLIFSQQSSASVPFEFSPVLGLVLAGSFLAGSRWLKHRQSNNFTK